MYEFQVFFFNSITNTSILCAFSKGVVDLISERSIYCEGPTGEEVRYDEVPKNMRSLVTDKRQVTLAVNMYAFIIQRLPSKTVG